MADMECKVAVMFTHDYLDGDLAQEDIKLLQGHLLQCPSCQTNLEALSRTDALLKALPKEAAPLKLGECIMNSLPKQRRPSAMTSWVRRHPAVSAAAIFMVVMLSSFVAMWNQEQELSVTGPDLEHIIFEGNKVIVPEGQKVNGNLTVVNGTVEVRGDLDGNLTVIDGRLLPLASTAHIAGEIKTIDRALDWFWYKVSSFFGTLTYGT
jgi:anti-sigma factor RsiW